MKPILFSGIQPSGELHIGNYLGAVKQWLDMQADYQAIFCVVDYHSLTEDFDPKKKYEQIFNTVVDFLACGLDPEKSIIFIQSHVSAHTELAWILNCLTPLAELERMTQYKDKAGRQQYNLNAGLLTYPILMAADILLYKTEIVPVGEDQVQHVELARVIARKFNHRFGDFFPEPQVKLNQAKRIMSLTHPDKKMSKSLGPKSYIALADSPETISDKIKSATTDSGSAESKGGGLNLLYLLKQFAADEQMVKKFENDYRCGQLKYAELKPVLADAISAALLSIREKKKQLLKDKKYVEKVFKDGAEKARAIAQQNLAEIKNLIGLMQL